MVAAALPLTDTRSTSSLRLVPTPAPVRWVDTLDGEQVEVTGEPQEGFGERPYRCDGLWYPCVVVVQGRDRGCPPVGAEVMRWLDGPGWVQA